MPMFVHAIFQSLQQLPNSPSAALLHTFEQHDKFVVLFTVTTACCPVLFTGAPDTEQGSRDGIAEWTI
jgi:hypothetical protein